MSSRTPLVAAPHGETLVERALQDRGFTVHNANIVFRSNCPNIDLVVYSRTGAIYVQVKSSRKPASKNHVTIDGSVWTRDQLDGAALYNKHDGFQASFIIVVDVSNAGVPVFYIAPPEELTRIVRKRGLAFAARVFLVQVDGYPALVK